MENKKFIIIGIIASLLLLSVYFIILSIASSFFHALEQFGQTWYWILPLAMGFGLQVGLYFYIRASFRLKQMASPTAVVAASGGITTGSMVACCLHYLVNVIPLIGLAGASIFLIKYQSFFVVIGIFSNLIGITIMLEIIQKHNLSNGLLKKLMIYNMNKIKKIVIVLSLGLLLLVFIAIMLNQEREQGQGQEQKILSESSETVNLLSKDSSQNNITFNVTPIDFSFDSPLKFEINIDTHSESLDFDLTRISILEDDQGNKYQPLNWDGSPSGGHHRSGIITFPEINNKVKNIKLVIQDNLGDPSRIFEWKLE